MAEQTKKADKKVLPAVILSISILVLIIVIAGGIVDGTVRSIANVFSGTFGISIFGLCAAGIGFSIFKFAKKRIVVETRYLVNFVVLFFVIVLLVHLFTALGLVSSGVVPTQTLGEYLATCYDFYDYPTFGGVFAGFFVYLLARATSTIGATIILIIALLICLWFVAEYLFAYANKPVFKEIIEQQEIKQEQPTQDVLSTQERERRAAYDVLFPIEEKEGNILYNSLEEKTNEDSIQEFPLNDSTKNVQVVENEEESKTVSANDFFADSEKNAYQRDLLNLPIITQADLDREKQQEQEQKYDIVDPAILFEPIEPISNDVYEDPVSIYAEQPVDSQEDVQFEDFEQPISHEEIIEDSFDENYNPDFIPPKPPVQLHTELNPVTRLAQENVVLDKEKTDFVVRKTTVDVAGGAQEKLIFDEKEEFSKIQSKLHRYSKYNPPMVDLLNDEMISADSVEEDHSDSAEAIVKKLASFGIDTRVVEIIVGPSVVRYVIELLSKIRIDEVKKYENDIKACLQTDKGINIETPLPGTSYIGVDAARTNPQIVPLRTVISSEKFISHKGGLCCCIGKEVSGKNVVVDIAKMPHMLVAGATNMGKSVCMNSIIISLMYKYSPEYLRFLLIDPKQVEFSMYERSPHLLTPTPIIDTKDALSCMDWLIDEMERRFTLFKNCKVKNIAEYNQKRDKDLTEFMYYIVFVVDELAELMTAFKKQFEPKITRLTQKARAAGIHIVLATQRPSTDIITGTIKNNLPCRIALKVPSYHDSQTILDYGGAENLIGRGDLLFKEPTSEVVRVQGALIETEEIDAVLEYIKENNETYYDEEIENTIFVTKKKEEIDCSPKDADDEKKEPEEDALLKDALVFWLTKNNGKASISSIQRNLGIGFNRAGRICDRLTTLGYLEKPSDSDPGNKPTKVTITLDEVEKLFPEPNDDE